MRRLFWIIPPLLGVAAYFTGLAGPPAAGTSDTEKGMSSASREEKGAAERKSPYHDIGDLTKALDEACAREHDRLLSLGPDELKSILLRLKKEADQSDTSLRGDQRIYLDLQGPPGEIATQLGRLQKQEAIDWVQEHCPDLYFPAMDGWAQADPEAVYDKVVHSTRLAPCTTATLMRMLQTFGERSPELLRERVKQTPWDLYPRRRDFFANSLGNIPLADAELGLWIDSGAAMEMHDMGLKTSTVLSRWTAGDPDRALSAWLSGQELPAGNREVALAQMLSDRPSSDFDPSSLQGAMDRLTPDDQQRLAAALSSLPGGDGYWKKRFPALFHEAVEEQR